MKKLLFLFFSITMVGVAVGQDTTHSDMKHKKEMKGKTDEKMTDYIMMKDGKLMVMKKGKITELDKEMTLSNGTKVMTDGRLEMSDGTTKTLEEGGRIYMNGKMGKKKMDKMDKVEKL